MKLKKILNSLFWKIFLSVWIANVLVMTVSTFILLTLRESSQFEDRQRERVETMARTIIHAKEMGVRVNNRFLREHNLRYRYGLVIKDEEGSDVFSLAARRLRLQNAEVQWRALELDLQSVSGEKYSVKTLVPGPPKIWRVALQRRNKIQFALIIVASSIVSFVLTWLITKPLKTLTLFNRRFAETAQHMALDAKILKRQDEIGELAREFEAMALSLSHTLNDQRELLHDISHELRAPLARLQVAAGIIAQKQALSGEGSPQKEILLLERECQRMSELISQILDYSRLNSKDEELTVIDLQTLIQERIDAIQFEFPDLKYQLNLSGELNYVLGDRELLNRALENILRNACKHSPPSGTVYLDADKNTPGKIHLRVRDEGEGVPTRDIDRLTQPFYRAGNKMHTEGFGLGLSICHKAMQKMKGELQLQNSPLGGLEVTLSLNTAQL